MAKRGFFAEINYQAQQAERRRLQQQAAMNRAHAAAERRAEQARKAAERAALQAQRADERARKEAEKEAARLHVEARVAEVEEMNAELAETYDQIDSLLASTLEVDDYVDLESLKVTEVEHPPFEPGSIGLETPHLPPLVYDDEPVYVEPPAPSGLAGAFGGKKKHAEAVAKARADHDAARARWQESQQRKYRLHVAEAKKREEREADRLIKLEQARAVYDQECRQREADAAARNDEVDKLINDLAFDVEDAIQTYVGIVLSNSVYPEVFSLDYDYAFALATRELDLTVKVPAPSTLPTVKEYRYVKAKDEITSTALTAKAQKDRYASAVWQTAVRSLHEVFEADRAGKIHSIALTVAVDTIAPATGQAETVPLVQVAADRRTFTTFDLANVVPDATLAHLGAAMSKSPFDLVPAGAGRGVRSGG